MWMRPALKIWRELPSWLQLSVARLVRPRYRVAVAGILLDDSGRILICRHLYRKAFPWGLPSGGLEYREQPEAGVLREVWEETGLDVMVERMLLAESAREDRHISLIYLCRIMGGSFKPNLETSQTQFFGLDELPNLLPTERALIERLRDTGTIPVPGKAAVPAERMA